MTLPDQGSWQDPSSDIENVNAAYVIERDRARDLEAEVERLRWRLFSVERALNEVEDYHDISGGALAFIRRVLDEAQRIDTGIDTDAH